ncbi:sporulation YhaL family protein [Tuberibacillus sp. Marseille-P3662]|uniref:sporulation YhaL family protein n=1 Tax=Tuberibacillus sp. Marseille-P3662 TaxID=1965358 RepID=UPI0020CAD029|nr:sporulation YhaL family protein [Tuberibacillus sp. Marseille-P3662]
MKQGKRSLIILGGLLVVYLLQQFGNLGRLGAQLAALPWWGYFVIAGIIFSAYQYFSISKDEQEVDEQWIEEQGKVYMKRIEKEREKRRQMKKTDAM